MKVKVVVLNWNNTSDIIETIDSLICQDYPNLEIVVVDNDSNEGVSSFVKNQFPTLTYIDNNENIGWAGGNNVGIRYALEQESDFIILSNNDIFIDDKSLISKIVMDFVLHPNKFGILGVRLMDYYDRHIIQEAGTIIFNSINDKFFVNNFIDKDRYVANSIKYFDSVSGAFMIISSKTIKQLGLIDENFFMYGEETEYCLRGWINGIKSAVDNSLVVYHKGAMSSGVGSPFMLYYKTRNLIYLLKKHRDNIGHYSFFVNKLILTFTKQFLRIILLKKYNWKHLTALINGIFHGAVSNKLGKYF